MMRSEILSRRLLFVGLVVLSVLTGGVATAGGSLDAGSTATAEIAAPTADTGSTNLQPGTTTANITANASVAANPNTANATATHTVTITIENGSANDLRGLVVDYSETDASVSLAVAKVKTVTLSGRNISESAVPSSLNGETVRFDFGSDRRLEAGDTLSVVYGGVRNPSKAGTYPIDVRINPTENRTILMAQLNISEAESAAETAVDNGDDIATDTGETGGSGEERGITDGNNTTETTSGSGPGLTLLVTVICVLAVGVGITWRVRA